MLYLKAIIALGLERELLELTDGFSNGFADGIMLSNIRNPGLCLLELGVTEHEVTQLTDVDEGDEDGFFTRGLTRRVEDDTSQSFEHGKLF